MIHPELHIVASMAETGKVYIYDLTSHVNAFDTPGMIPNNELNPIHTISSHGTSEGYGIDWSPINIGSLLTGDGKGRILLTNKSATGFNSEKLFFTGHTSSIEDIQWSPSQSNVFASCSADKTIKIWDTRINTKFQLSVLAHSSDVNVISWNKSVDYLLASGSDSGEFSVWDLRNWTLQKTPETAAKFNWHQAPITSIEWHSTESSVLAASGADDQLTVWDLSLERDEDEEVIMGTNSLGDEIQVPAQLLFIHQGQKNIKELHWHNQIPGLIISTSFDGFNVFKPFNV
jgi:ribosome assembly protein RRB1